MTDPTPGRSPSIGGAVRIALGLLVGSLVLLAIGMLLFPGSNLPGGPLLIVPAAVAAAIGWATLFGAGVASLMGWVQRSRARRRRGERRPGPGRRIGVRGGP